MADFYYEMMEAKQKPSAPVPSTDTLLPAGLKKSDNIITDYPQKLRRFLEAWNSLSNSEKIVLMLRKFFVVIEGPEPSEL